VFTESLAGDGEARTIRLAHWSRPEASSKPLFCLPTMNRRLSA
jgi:hypothetical protein